MRSPGGVKWRPISSIPFCLPVPHVGFPWPSLEQVNLQAGNLLGMDRCAHTVAIAVRYATARQAQQSAAMWTSGNGLRKQARVKLGLPCFLALEETDPTRIDLEDGPYQLLVVITRGLLCFRRLHQLLHRPSNVGFDGPRYLVLSGKVRIHLGQALDNIVCHDPEPRKSGVCKYKLAYRMLPLTSGEVTLPATRTMKSSPKLASKVSSGGPRESAQTKDGSLVAGP